jgi:hypothetical protein
MKATWFAYLNPVTVNMAPGDEMLRREGVDRHWNREERREAEWKRRDAEKRERRKQEMPKKNVFQAYIGIKGKKIFKDHITLSTLFYFKRIRRDLSSCVSFMLRATICGFHDRRREIEVLCLWGLCS